MRVKNLGRRLNESFTPLIIFSVLFELLVKGEYIHHGLAEAFVNAAAFLCYIVWAVTTLRRSLIEGTHRKTYYLTNGIVVLLLAVVSCALSIIHPDPYYYFMFSPFGSLSIAGFLKPLISNIIALCIIFACYLIVPRTVKRRRHHHHHRDSGPVDTTNFILKS